MKIIMSWNFYVKAEGLENNLWIFEEKSICYSIFFLTKNCKTSFMNLTGFENTIHSHFLRGRGVFSQILHYVLTRH